VTLRHVAIRFAVTGIGLDVGGGPGDLSPGFADLVHAAYPRLGGTRALTDAIERQAVADPRKAPPGSLPGEIIRSWCLHLGHDSRPERLAGMSRLSVRRLPTTGPGFSRHRTDCR
jgi:hypothetical protein